MGRFACEFDTTPETNSDCMWKKPSQITGYYDFLFKCCLRVQFYHVFRFNGTVYEIGPGFGKTASDVIEGFKKSPPHKSVMLNEDGTKKGGLDWSKQFGQHAGEELHWGSVGSALLHDGANHLAGVGDVHFS